MLILTFHLVTRMLHFLCCLVMVIICAKLYKNPTKDVEVNVTSYT